MLSENLHRNIYILGLVVIAVSLPLSRFMLSVGQLIIAANWLLEGRFKGKWLMLKSNHRGITVFLFVVFVPVIWLMASQNIEQGLINTRIKLPFLVVPLVMATIKPLTSKELKWILYFFIIAVVAGSIASMFRFVQVRHDDSFDMRNLSVFISHIRFSLQIVLAIMACGYFMFKNVGANSKYENLLLVLLGLWLTLFLFILHALTGIVIFVALFVLLLLQFIYRYTQFKYAGIIVLAMMLGGIALYLFHVSSLVTEPKLNTAKLDMHTQQGNAYSHDTTVFFVENRHYVWLYVQEGEMSEAWNNRSTIDYSGKDKKGQSIKHTLIRYLTSKGLRKDSVGVWQLSEEDIDNVEEGLTNYLFAQRSGLFKRVYELFWEIDVYQKGVYATGHSLLQRMEYAKLAVRIIKNNFWTGLGTGSVNDAFFYHSNEKNTRLIHQYWGKAHNQYLTTFLTFGVFGFLAFWFSFIYPIVKNRKHVHPLTYIFLIIIFLSMVNDDTLETHVGVSFVAFFYALFIFGSQKGYEKN